MPLHRHRRGAGQRVFAAPGGRSHGAQRSGSSPWKRSFCSSRSDRNGTVPCRCRLDWLWVSPGFPFPPARRRLFRTCVRLSVRRSVVKSRSVGGERTFRFGTCGPLFHSEPSLCGGEVPPFRSRFLPVSTQRGVRPIPSSALEVPERPSRCAVTPSACRWVSGRKTALVVTLGG